MSRLSTDGTMAASNVSGTSVWINGRLPIACSEDFSTSAADDRSGRHANVASASCSPWQSGFRQYGDPVSTETIVKSAAEPATRIPFSLQSDAADGQRMENSEQLMPCCVSNSNIDEDIISLHADYRGAGEDQRLRTADGELCSRLDGMTVADASPDEHNKNSAHAGLVSTSCVTRHHLT